MSGKHKFHDPLNPQKGEQGKTTKKGTAHLLKAIGNNVTGKGKDGKGKDSKKTKEN